VTERRINFNNTFAPGFGFTSVWSSNTVPAGVWAHVVAVRVGNELLLYIRGSLVGATSATRPPDYSRGFVPEIGGNSGSNTDNYAGLIDDIRIYDRALSASEVHQLYVYESQTHYDAAFQIVAGSFTWSQAKSDAESRGGHLATFGTQAKWDALVTEFNSRIVVDAWIGGYQVRRRLECPSEARPAGPWPSSRNQLSRLHRD